MGEMGGRRVRQGTSLTSWVAAISCMCLLSSVSAQFGGFGGPAAKEAVPAVKSDLPYIRCSVCEALAKNAYRQIKAAKDAQKPGKKVMLQEPCNLGDTQKTDVPLIFERKACTQ